MRNHFVRFIIANEVQVPADPVPTLKRMVADVEVIYAANTDRRFTLDPENPWRRGELPPIQGSAVYPLDDYGVTVYIGFSGTTGGGWTRIAENGDADVMFNTARIYETGGSEGSNGDGWHQVWIIVHELAHNMGVELGEATDRYYIGDMTGVDPICPVNADNPACVLWGRLSDWASDPMLHQNGQRFSDHSARVINGRYRMANEVNLPPTAPLDCAIAISGGVEATVRVWSVDSHSSACTLIADKTTTLSGWVDFRWPDNPRTNDAVLVKVFADGYEPAVVWLTIVEMEEAGMSNLALIWLVTMKRLPPAPVLAIEAIQGTPGMLKVTGITPGRWFQIMAGPFESFENPELRVVVAVLTCDLPEMIWVDPRPLTGTMYYGVRALTPVEAGTEWLARVASVIGSYRA